MKKLVFCWMKVSFYFCWKSCKPNAMPNKFEHCWGAADFIQNWNQQRLWLTSNNSYRWSPHSASRPRNLRLIERIAELEQILQRKYLAWDERGITMRACQNSRLWHWLDLWLGNLHPFRGLSFFMSGMLPFS